MSYFQGKRQRPQLRLGSIHSLTRSITLTHSPLECEWSWTTRGSWYNHEQICELWRVHMILSDFVNLESVVMVLVSDVMVCDMTEWPNGEWWDNGPTAPLKGDRGAQARAFLTPWGGQGGRLSVRQGQHRGLEEHLVVYDLEQLGWGWDAPSLDLGPHTHIYDGRKKKQCLFRTCLLLAQDEKVGHLLIAQVVPGMQMHWVW